MRQPQIVDAIRAANLAASGHRDDMVDGHGGRVIRRKREVQAGLAETAETPVAIQELPHDCGPALAVESSEAAHWERLRPSLRAALRRGSDVSAAPRRACNSALASRGSFAA